MGFTLQWQGRSNTMPISAESQSSATCRFCLGHIVPMLVPSKLFDLDDTGHHGHRWRPARLLQRHRQRWGNLLYDWGTHAQDGYHWWTARIRSILSLCDIIRIDHFRGFESYWKFLPTETAINGTWKSPAQEKLSSTRRSANPSTRASEHSIIAESQNHHTRSRHCAMLFGLPGMRMQFALTARRQPRTCPHNFEATVVLRPHDNITPAELGGRIAGQDPEDYVPAIFGIPENPSTGPSMRHQHRFHPAYPVPFPCRCPRTGLVHRG